MRLHYDYGLVLPLYGIMESGIHGPDIGAAVCRGGASSRGFVGRMILISPWLQGELRRVHYGFIRGQIDDLITGRGQFKRNNDWRGPFVDLAFLSPRRRCSLQVLQL